MRSGKFGSFFRRWSRTIHRELSFFFGGVVLIYAISGFLLNHKRDFNAEYDITRKEFRVESMPQSRTGWNKAYVLSLLGPLNETDNYTKHYFPSASQVKVPQRRIVVGNRYRKRRSTVRIGTQTSVVERAQPPALQSRTLVDHLFRHLRLLADPHYAHRAGDAQGA